MTVQICVEMLLYLYIFCIIDIVMSAVHSFYVG